MINDIMEETCGARLTMNYMVPGGVMYDISSQFPAKGERNSLFILKVRSMNMTSW